MNLCTDPRDFHVVQQVHQGTVVNENSAPFSKSYIS